MMAITWSTSLIKYLLLAFNLVFVITGFILLGVGVTVKSHYSDYDIFLDNQYFSLPNLLIATGVIILLISFLGCYGVFKESSISLLVFCGLLIIIFIFEFSAGIAGYVLRDNTASYLEGQLTDSLNQYKTDTGYQQMWDAMQRDFKCCGRLNMSDWSDAFKSSDLPMSCCPMQDGIVGVFYCNSQVSPNVDYDTNNDVTTSSTTISSSTISSSTISSSTISSSTISSTTTTSPTTTSTTLSFEPVPKQSTTSPYTEGCQSLFVDLIKAYAVDIGGVGIALAVIQLLGVVFSFYLVKQWRNVYQST